jgi:large subunit ribosomal protein L29
MSVIELRKKTVNDLKEELLVLLREQFDLRMQRLSQSSEVTKTHVSRRLRRDIARVKTILHERADEL